MSTSSLSSTSHAVMTTAEALLLTTLFIGVSRATAQNDATSLSSGPTPFISTTVTMSSHTNTGVNMTSTLRDQRQPIRSKLFNSVTLNSSIASTILLGQMGVNEIQSTTKATLRDTTKTTTTNLLPVQPTTTNGLSHQMASASSRQKAHEGAYNYLDDFTSDENGWESDQPSDDSQSDEGDETDSDDDDGYNTHDTVMNENDVMSQYNYNNVPSSFDDEANSRYYGNYSVDGGSLSNTDDTGKRQYGGQAGDLSLLDLDAHLVRDISVPDDSLRRLMTSSSLNSRSEPINISLLVIYSWLGLVVIMVIITIITYRYKEPLNDAWAAVCSFVCRARSKRSRGIEESNTLLTHPLV